MELGDSGASVELIVLNCECGLVELVDEEGTGTWALSKGLYRGTCGHS